MARPWLLDLFCGAGGAAMGYHRAGFDVLGVDIKPQPNYPFPFIEGDALAIGTPLLQTGRFAAVHASPPCQRFSTMTKRHGTQFRHADLVAPTRTLLTASGLPYVIENVEGAPLIEPVVLCGSMFAHGAMVDGMWRQLRRHRLFESNLPLTVGHRCVHVGGTIGVYGKPGGSSKRDGIQFGTVTDWRAAMAIDWMTYRELAQAIPPAYTAYLGRQVLAALVTSEAVA